MSIPPPYLWYLITLPKNPSILTPKKNLRLKMKRPPTAKKYRTHLDELYAEALAEEESGKNTKAKL